MNPRPHPPERISVPTGIGIPERAGRASRHPRLEELPELMRQRDLRKLGLTRTDADRVIALCPGIVRFGKAVYVRREDVERVLAAALDTSEVR